MKNIIFPVILLCLLFTACSENSNDEAAMITVDSNQAIASSELLLDSTRAYITSGQLRMEVKNIIKAKSDITQIIKQQKGFILSSELNNQVNWEKNIAINSDSSQLYKSVTSSNSFSVLVPQSTLDSTVGLLEAYGIYVDKSSIGAQDISSTIKSNSEKEEGDAFIAKSKKLKTSVASLQYQKELIDERNASKRFSSELAYQQKYSRLNIDIYAAPQIFQQVVVNNTAYDKVNEPFGYSVKLAIQDGIYTFQSFLLLLIKFWLVIPFVLFVILGWKAIKKRKRISHS